MFMRLLLPVVLFLGRGDLCTAAPNGENLDMIITAAPVMPRLQALQSGDPNTGGSEESGDMRSWGVDGSQGCPAFSQASFESSVSSCFTEQVGRQSGCEFEDKLEWLFPGRGQHSDTAQFSSCVCPVSRLVIDSCLMGCPRAFTDISIGLQWTSICTGETTQAGGDSSQSTQGSSSAASGSDDMSDTASASASAGAEETGGESDGSDGVPLRGTCSIWLVILTIAVALGGW